MENLHDKRQVYEQFELHDHEVKENPMEHFKEWFADADKHPDIFEANAMILSTIDDDGCPRTRAMLLKSYSQEGFIPIIIVKKGSLLTRTRWLVSISFGQL